MVQVDKRDGSRLVIYGHATKNVIDEFRDHYVDDDHCVEVCEYQQRGALE